MRLVAGFYCLEGSTVLTPCPAGHFSPLSGISSISDCSPCPVGFFCNSSGLTEASGPCKAGHFCSLGSTDFSPISQSYGDVCSMGHFCPEGSGSPQPCGIGSFLPESGASSPSHCLPCTPGKYCQSPGAPQPTGLCSAGFFCSGGADSPTPRANSSLFSCLHKILEASTMKTGAAFWMHNLSLFHNSRTSGDDLRTDVLASPWSNTDHHVTLSPPSRQTDCSTFRGDICPEGFYCPVGSAYPQPCAAGTFCNQTGLDAPLGPCDAGYYCPAGSKYSYASLCPPGHYCPPGTPAPLPCPIGTVQSEIEKYSIITVMSFMSVKVYNSINYV
ncbi:uncharacterized protein LOC112486963 [Cynoglossus semilaevis]|uniref:uncharacterized protein LOC112486963 n=1 Tax=Cynoglossus semilaevis TaxID=244447 RepID=UPI000D630A9B|nr:uncharacterized protein LOC112486963 [Cynoglossus semilaevis]